jgi:alpha,alpha-trehalase
VGKDQPPGGGMDEWEFVYEEFDPDSEALREALCTLGNGYFATRGAAPESEADDIHYPGTYLAGGYKRLVTEVSGRELENEDLVNFPNWLPLNFRIDGGEWFQLRDVELIGYKQTLYLKLGELTRTVYFTDKAGRETQLLSRRIVHMFQPHLAAQLLQITAVNWSGKLEIRSALDGKVQNLGVKRYRTLSTRHLEPLEQAPLGEDGIYLKVQTSQSEIRVAQAARTRLYRGDEELSPERRLICEPGFIAQQLEVEIGEGETLTAEKTLALFTSKDTAISECGIEARRLVVRPGRFNDLARSHAMAWGQLWRRFEVEINLESPEQTQTTNNIIRLYIFHLLQTVSPNTRNIDAGVPARGWHGEAYRGHIFWDELFIFPLLNLRIPEITRALLHYRYSRLGEARYNARENGFQGAMYPWQSGSDGREESQKLHLNPKSGRWIPDNSSLQRHVNGAVAYNVWLYYQGTQDIEFLSYFGAEIIREVARFFGSLARFNEEKDRYEILGVVGPDEYHEAYPDSEEAGLNNNAYTNVLAVWVLTRALEVIDLLPEHRRLDLTEVLNLRDEELALWERIRRKMCLVFHEDGVISQFEGYERLKEFDWQGYRVKYGDIQRLDRILEAENDSPNRYKLSKQADVLMLFYLFSTPELIELFGTLGYTLNEDIIRNTIAYYLQRTSHGSTLSRVVHSWVLIRTDRNGSWEHFMEALYSDVADIQGGTTPEGIHLGAMAGTVDLIQRAYTGIETHGDVLWLSPRLPEQLLDQKLHLVYRGYSLGLFVNHKKMVVSAEPSNASPIKIGYHGEVFVLHQGETREFLRPSRRK